MKIQEFVDRDWDSFGGAVLFPNGDNPLIFLLANEQDIIVADGNGYSIITEDGNELVHEVQFESAAHATRVITENYK